MYTKQPTKEELLQQVADMTLENGINIVMPVVEDILKKKVAEAEQLKQSSIQAAISDIVNKLKS